jgi:hypothetical protein
VVFVAEKVVWLWRWLWRVVERDGGICGVGDHLRESTSKIWWLLPVGGLGVLARASTSKELRVILTL